ncbi:centrosomal protein of 85 kDa isoform X1 [Ranitomeya imitator]|uniref:centrosomal protein of 85 kDa isoform X1 n=1 Tax=Ranitomeya imitator TaxID=111125 RepID=UPI0037E985BC
MATRDGYKDSGSQLPCITGTGMGAGKHGNSSSYTVWQTPQMSVKPLIRASASHVTQIVSSLPEGIPEHADDFCKASGSSSAHPIRSQIIPMAHVVPSTIVTSSKSRISVLPAESSEDGSPYAPPAEPSAIEDHRKFEMPNIEPTMNQSALLNTLCVDGRFELPTADMGRSAEQYKTLPESREIGGGELTHRVICPPSNLRCHSWQPDSCSSQPAAAEYNSWRLQQQCTDNMRMQKLQFVSDYSAPMYAAGLHPIPIEWERVVKASDNIIMEKEIILERQRQHIAVLEQKLREGELQVHSTVLSQSSPYNMCHVRLQVKELQEQKLVLQEQVREMEKKLGELRATYRESKAQLAAQKLKEEEHVKTIEGFQREIQKFEMTDWKEEERRLTEEANKLRQELESSHKGRDSLQNVIESYKKKMEQMSSRMNDLEAQACHEAATGQALKEDSLEREAALQELKVVAKDLASQNQDLVECNLTLQEQVRLASLRAQPSNVEGSHLFTLCKEMNRCQKDLRSICCLLSQRVQGVDPNLSILLGVNSNTGLDAQEEDFDFFTVEKYLHGVEMLKRDIEELRTTISDCYAQDMGDNCITQ